MCDKVGSYSFPINFLKILRVNFLAWHGLKSRVVHVHMEESRGKNDIHMFVCVSNIQRSVGFCFDTRWLRVSFIIYLSRFSNLFVILLSEINKSQVHTQSLFSNASSFIEFHRNMHKYCTCTLNKKHNLTNWNNNKNINYGLI